MSVHPVWKSLLHFHKQRFFLPDENFLLSAVEDADLESVLRDSIALFATDKKAKCRFPARYLWLQAQGVVPRSDLVASCPQYAEFVQRVPVDKISLIFASERLAVPSSMMGHSLLSFEGINSFGDKVEHSVSFSVALPSNPYSLIKEVVLVGKPGKLMVEPLNEPLARYLEVEQRNLWKYPLALSDSQKELIQAHVWELKSVLIPYRFQSHNCATLLLDIVSLAIEADHYERAAWISPTDLAKILETYGLIQQKELLPSKQWMVRTMLEFLSESDQRQVDSWLDNPNSDINLSDAQQLLARYLLEYRYHQQMISVKTYRDISAQMAEWDVVQISFDSYRDPLKSIPDSHIRLGWRHDADGEWLLAGFLPAAHDLHDDNRNYFSESALRLTDMQIRFNAKDHSLQLDEWMLYEVSALNAYHPLTGGLSGFFSLGFDRREHTALSKDLGLSIHGGGGYTRKLATDLGVYGLLGMGTHKTREETRLYAMPEIGMWIYEIGNMKSWLNYSVDIPINGNSVHRTTLDHSIGLGSKARLVFTAENVKTREQSRWNINASIRFYH